MDSSSISFTALYTGQVWCEYGLAEPFFSSSFGKLMYQGMRPVESLTSLVAGFNIKQWLLQRHHIIDYRIKHLMEQQGVDQILEIACGLSPRGYRFSQTYPSLTYVEADLPSMARRKQQLLQEHLTLNEKHRVITCNFFESGPPHGLNYVLEQQFDQTKPILIITEGLVNYFDLPTMESVWSDLSCLARAFPEAWYITDLIAKLRHNPAYRYLTLGKRALSTLASAKVSLHYDNDEAIEHGFKSCGFDQVKIHRPEDYYHKLPIPRSRSAAMIRVIEARLKGTATHAETRQ